VCTKTTMKLSTVLRLWLIPGAIAVCAGQSLTLDSAMSAPGSTTIVAIRLAGAAGPAAMQWTLGYASADFSSVTITAGPAAAAAGKSVSCYSVTGSLRCVASGMNANVIADGVLATASLTLTGHVADRSLSLTAAGASPSGDASAIGASGGFVTMPPPPVTPSSLSCTPASVTAPGLANCQVTLSAGAPAGGLAVAIASGAPYVATPTAIAIPAGSLQGNFVADVAAAAMDGPVAITASANGASATFALEVVVPPAISSLSCDPTTLAADASAVCTIALNKNALPGGVTVGVSADSGLLQVPATAVIGSGLSTATFSAKAGAVTSSQNAVLTATLGSSARTISFSLMPPPVVCPCSVWGPADRPVTITDPDSAAVELGMKFRTSVAGYILGVRFYKGPQNTGTHAGRIWSRDGKRLATINFSNETASGWQQMNFSTPVPVQANTTYVVSYRAPRGKYSGDNYYFSSVPVAKGPLTALQNGQDGGNGVYKYGTAGFPSSTFLATNYWVDVVFNTTPSFASTAIPQAAEGPLVSYFQTSNMLGRAGELSNEDAVTFSIPEHEVLEPGETLNFVAAAADGRESLTVSARELPAGAQFDRVSARVIWTPTNEQRGTHRLRFVAKDRAGRELLAESVVTVGERAEEAEGKEPD
jgi:hypothetical protein